MEVAAILFVLLVGVGIGVALASLVRRRRVVEAPPRGEVPKAADRSEDDELVDLTRRNSPRTTFDPPNPGGPEWMPPGREPEA